MFSFSKANHNVTSGGKVDDSSITNSSIDMNGGIITSHIMPINPLDVANKQYVDLKIDEIETIIIINLTGTNFQIVSNDLEGHFVISIRNMVSGGPSASFKLIKNSPSVYPGYVRDLSIPGINTLEKLDMSWDPGTGLAVRKTGVHYDGQYKVKLIKN
jgi:hypothetical protein